MLFVELGKARWGAQRQSFFGCLCSGLLWGIVLSGDGDGDVEG